MNFEITIKVNNEKGKQQQQQHRCGSKCVKQCIKLKRREKIQFYKGLKPDGFYYEGFSKNHFKKTGSKATPGAPQGTSTDATPGASSAEAKAVLSEAVLILAEAEAKAVLAKEKALAANTAEEIAEAEALLEKAEVEVALVKALSIAMATAPAKATPTAPAKATPTAPTKAMPTAPTKAVKEEQKFVSKISNKALNPNAAPFYPKNFEKIHSKEAHISQKCMKTPVVPVEKQQQKEVHKEILKQTLNYNATPYYPKNLQKADGVLDVKKQLNYNATPYHPQKQAVLTTTAALPAERPPETPCAQCKGCSKQTYLSKVSNSNQEIDYFKPITTKPKFLRTSAKPTYYEILRN